MVSANGARAPLTRAPLGTRLRAGFVLMACFGLLSLVTPRAMALDVPKLAGRVNDLAGLLPASSAAALETRLADYEARTGNQFVLLTVPSLEGDEIASFGIRVAEHWKLGQKGKDNGLILIIAPQDKKMRIEVGYGLEGNVPDAIAARVIRDVLGPSFRRGDFAGGIDAAFGVLMHAASGEGSDALPPEPTSQARKRSPFVALLPVLLPLLLFFLLSNAGGGGRRRGGGFYVGPGFGGGFGGGGRHGGGGGFGGGGGGFGGGGASGEW
jgi:uncharacterized protein